MWFFVILRCFLVLFVFLPESQSRRQCPTLSSPKQLLQEAKKQIFDKTFILLDVSDTRHLK